MSLQQTSFFLQRGYSLRQRASRAAPRLAQRRGACLHTGVRAHRRARGRWASQGSPAGKLGRRSGVHNHVAARRGAAAPPSQRLAHSPSTHAASAVQCHTSTQVCVLIHGMYIHTLWYLPLFVFIRVYSCWGGVYYDVTLRGVSTRAAAPGQRVFAVHLGRSEGVCGGGGCHWGARAWQRQRLVGRAPVR